MSINFIPGSEVLGWGFNIFGSYSVGSKTRQMFQFPDTGQTTQPMQPNGTVYLLPGNVQVVNRNQSVSDTQVFESRSHVEDYFSGQAGMSTRIGEPGVKFSGQFDAMFSGAAQSDSATTVARTLFEILTALSSWVDRTRVYARPPGGAMGPLSHGDPGGPGVPLARIRRKRESP